FAVLAGAVIFFSKNRHGVFRHLQRKPSAAQNGRATLRMKRAARWPRSSRSGAAFRSRVLETRDRAQTLVQRSQAAKETCTPPRVEAWEASLSSGLARAK